ncbi:hypothetical protein AC578_10649 [Pseudocercospora eumusae]|uniref:Zn(2)-C6 fungal-type domain-containing protein n=1 Tax=Pseudocercospora eumusae TaxID=321146 RepID=A0A139HJ88_9PEZI|nr:hypothetical protein AC578_10649 [Pseudocercospora eumusae]
MAADSTVAVERQRNGSTCSTTSSNGTTSSKDKQLVRAERRPGHQRRYAPKTRTGCITCKVCLVYSSTSRPTVVRTHIEHTYPFGIILSLPRVTDLPIIIWQRASEYTQANVVLAFAQQIRRVKCDEEKPFCKRCTTTGRKCDGYAQIGESPPARSTYSPEPLSVALVNDVSSDALERRTFDFFRARTVPACSGYFHDSVWDRLVLQLSHSEPAVRHAVNALGAIHEERSLRRSASRGGIDVSLVKTGFPILQYSKALNQMQDLLRAGTASLDVIILCSLLCIHFEALREAFVPAIMHVENAIQLLHSTGSPLDVRKINPSLVRAVMRMDLQSTMYLGSRVPGLPFFTASTDSVLPHTFHDLVQGRDLVNTWTSRIFHFTRTVADSYKFHEAGDIPLEVIAAAHDLEHQFLKLDTLLWEFMHKPTVKLSIREQHGLGMLRSRVKINRILAATCLYSEASVFDRYLDTFEEILTICMYIMGSDNADYRLFSVSLDEGLIHPLFFLACQCREGRIRHQALAHLKKLPVRDGVWHVETTTRTAEMCIRFEEALFAAAHPDRPQSATCADIPEWRRIHSAGFDGWDDDGPKNHVKVHLRTRPNGTDGEWLDFEESIQWHVPVKNKSFHESFAALVPKFSKQFSNLQMAVA